MAKPPTIAELAVMDDAGLMEALGFATKLAQAKEDLTQLATLTGAAREHAEERVMSMLTPNIYPSDLSYLYEDSQRHAKQAKKGGKEEMEDTAPSPSSVI